MVEPWFIDLAALLRKSVMTLYSDLVTRPTGRAVRLGIEQQLGSAAGPCVFVVDFSQVGILDFSCADEIVAKLLLRYRAADRPGEAFFFLRGVAEHHREPIESVLDRHGLLLGAEARGGERLLLGPASDELRRLWHGLEELRRATAGELAHRLGIAEREASAGLATLAEHRTAVQGPAWQYLALGALVSGAAIW